MEGAHGADEHREGERLTLSDAAAAWSGATYERIAEALAPIHRRIVEMLEPQPGERFLDLACGTGGVALVAARTGADVTGLDISADQLVKAQAAAEEAGVSITFDEGDAQALPYADSSFDAVASVFGMIFAPDHGRAGAELTRVCRPGRGSRSRRGRTTPGRSSVHGCGPTTRASLRSRGRKRSTYAGCFRSST